LYHWSKNRSIKIARMKAAWYQRFDMMRLNFDMSDCPMRVCKTENLTARRASAPVLLMERNDNRCPPKSMSQSLCPIRAETYANHLSYLARLAAHTQTHVYMRPRRIVPLHFATGFMPRSSKEQAFKHTMRGISPSPSPAKPNESPKDLPVASPSAR